MTGRLSDIHWLAPTTILLSLFLGIAVAIGHHAFYKSLEGTGVRDDDLSVFGSSISRQQVNIAGGTAFAFVVKAALSTAVSTAYIQLFWRNLIRAAQQAPTLSTIDSLFSVFSNGFHLGKVWLWWRYPLLFCLAATAWLIPIASIVTPATLSVTNVPVMPRDSEKLHVPNIGFVNLNYVDSMNPPPVSNSQASISNESVEYYYTGPSRDVVDVVQAVSYGGAILRIDPPRSNTSWGVSFHGPALQCKDVTSPSRQEILWNMANASGITPEAGQDCNPTAYIAWTGYGSERNGSIPMPFPSTKTRTKYNSTTTYSSSNTTLSTMLDFYMAVMPGVMDVVLFGDTFAMGACAWSTADPAQYFPPSTVLHCQMINSSYSVALDYTGSQQNISVTTLDLPGTQKPLARADSVQGPPEHYGDDPTFTRANCSVLNSIGNVCEFDQALVETLSYQAILEAFSDLIFGKVSNPERTTPIFESSIRNTPLTNTPELAFLDESVVISSMFSAIDLQAAVQTTNGTLFQGLVKQRTETASTSLAQAIEDLFSDIVVSMMSSEQLQPDQKSPFAPSAVNVTFYDFHNVYTYSAAKLWIAYGLAILFAFLASVAGLLILVANRASYSANFSSAVLFGRGADFSVQPKEEDMRGRDPVPKHLARAKVWSSGAGLTHVFDGRATKAGNAESVEHSKRPLLKPDSEGQRPLTRQTL